MKIRTIADGIFSVGAVDWDRRLFDSLIPLPEGTSYNAYVIRGGSKNALADTVDPSMTHVLLENLKSFPKIDYVIAHHGEQDHSGVIPEVLANYPEAKVVTTPKCKDILIDHLHVSPEKFVTVNDGDVIDLGGRTLQFIHTPWVHWPETMCTYLKEDKILFSCDFFGSHLASSELFVADEAKVYDSAKRYYAEIMMPFRSMIKKHLEIVDKLVIDVIATSHGPIYDKPSFIIDAYRDWITDEVKNEVVIPYVSMHGSTQAMVDYFIDALEKKGITVKPFNLTKTDLGELAMALVDAATIVIGSPTVLVGAHPAAVNVAFLANALRPKAKFLSIIGSYGWGGKMVDQLKGLIPVLKVELLDPVVIKGFPKEEDLRKLDGLAEAIAQKHREDILVRKG